MSQADAINSRAAEVADWLQSVIDIPGPPFGTTPQPDKLRRISPILCENNEEYYKKYYTPKSVPIGPIHCQNHDGQSMKDLKRKAVKQLAEGVKDEVSIEQVYTNVEEELLRARNCYSCDIIESFQDDREWCKMMFLDGCFVVGFICNYKRSRLNLNVKKDLAFLDLLLYENQLPFQILDALADAFGCKEDFHHGFILMSFEMPFMLTIFSAPAPTFLDYIQSCLPIKFRQSGLEKKFVQFLVRLMQWNSGLENRAPAHLLQYYLDLLIFFLEKNDSEDDGDDVFVDGDERHLLEIFFGTEGACRPPSTVTELNKVSSKCSSSFSCPPATVTELKKVGIKCSSFTSLSDISVHSYMLSGKLFLPPLTFNHRSKTLILNLAAYEFSCFPKYRSSGFSSCLSSMGTFIHGEEDVKELRARGLVQLNHEDDDDHAVVDFFRYIAAHYEPNRKVIRHVKQQISTYFNSKRLPLRVAYAEFKQRYFSGPWNFLVFLAVIFTVSMTIIQTALTGIQTFEKD